MTARPTRNAANLERDVTETEVGHTTMDPVTADLHDDQTPEETSILAASLDKIRRLEEIMQILPYICEPLQSALSSSEYITQVPKNWFYVTFTPLYDATDRAYAARARLEDPCLLHRFIEADINILLRDPRVNGGHVRAYISSKFGFHGATIAELLAVPSLGWLLDALEDSGTRPASRYMTFILDKVQADG